MSRIGSGFRLLSLVAACSTAVACVTVKTSPGRSAEYVEPVAWGAMSQPDGCVIFREYHKTKVGFFVVALTTRTHGELEVLESKGYEMPKKIWLQTQEDMDELQRVAMKERLRFVKIRDKYQASELAEARDLCARADIGGEA